MAGHVSGLPIGPYSSASRLIIAFLASPDGLSPEDFNHLQAIVSLRLVPRADGAGRVPATEVMIATETVKEYLVDSAKIPLIRALSKKALPSMECNHLISRCLRGIMRA